MMERVDASRTQIKRVKRVKRVKRERERERERESTSAPMRRYCGRVQLESQQRGGRFVIRLHEARSLAGRSVGGGLLVVARAAQRQSERHDDGANVNEHRTGSQECVVARHVSSKQGFEAKVSTKAHRLKRNTHEK